MKIALIGYGKMGHAIERIALERGHEIVARIDIHNHADIESEAFRSADVAIEFTTPATAFDNCEAAMRQGVPVVCGSTGWTSAMPRMEALVNELGAKFFWTSNFSLGVNIFFEINRRLAEMMNRFPAYTPSMKEIHHIHKLDHPSGTAVSLAEDIVESVDRIGRWTENPVEPGAMFIDHERQGEVPGTHIITWDSAVDTITLEHRAKSRDGFALGAVIAAEWLPGCKPGFHHMTELLAAL
ncbi:MAG: 4-hydroxy-tetrahydrodipicolinate reductase [Bacteroides sp.]|nr:4-hydroxy-tetrahydrodipicolinate reductase [Bacteroides sp.]MBD5377299.1 4-hydroxy-tetrahydrodipicolinate reductase [Bacteroides sp.]